MKQYGVILADPPWNYTISHRRGAAEKHYPTMALEEMERLPIPELALPNSVLLMWATWPKLDEACLPLMKAWGFRYVTGFPWVKIHGVPTPTLFGETIIRLAWGTGYWSRGSTEPFLIGVRGNASPPDTNWAGIFCESVQHSRKPETAHHYAMSLPGPYIELFARRPYPGWDVWGNQVKSTVEIEAA